MITFRPHRGSLRQSTKEQVEYESIEEMKKDISCKYFGEEDIVIKESKHPYSKEYDQILVCVKKFGGEDYIEKYGTAQCIGYIDKLN